MISFTVINRKSPNYHLPPSKDQLENRTKQKYLTDSTMKNTITVTLSLIAAVTGKPICCSNFKISLAEKNVIE